MDTPALEKEFESDRESLISEFMDWLRIPSVSADPSFHPQCRKSAEWLRDRFVHMGLKVNLLETPSLPVVHAEYKGQPGAPVILYYGHYDVQPAERADGWNSDPFVPEIRNGHIYARGAVDNKGQTFYVIRALQTLIKHKALGCTVKIIIEGEEECGSEGLSVKAVAWKDLLQADVLLVCDTNGDESSYPAIEIGCRGLVCFTATLHGPKADLHSGIYGGMVRNPATELSRLIASLHNADGSIAVKNYYEDVKPLSADEHEAVLALKTDLQAFEKEVGVPANGGEAGYLPEERAWFRPTIEINGLHSGYGGKGAKTIIPSHAFAKITQRLVLHQNPRHALRLVQEHLQARVPAGMRLEFSEQTEGAGAINTPVQAACVQLARQSISRRLGKAPVIKWSGGSIPVLKQLSEVSGAAILGLGLGRVRDNWHGPDESFAIERLRLGYLMAAGVLQDLKELRG